MRLRTSLALLLSGWLLAPAAGAQDEGATFRADTRLVVLHASVLDRNGRLLTDLKREAFKVFENGVEQSIKTFRREDIPVSMGILVDNSGSMRNKRQKVEAAALALVKESNRQDEVFIVNFNDEAYLDVPFTGDIAKLEEGLARIDSRGGTAMRDAISMSIDEVRDKGKRDKKVLVVITDGNDNTSTLPLEKLVEKAHRTEVLIYLIGLLNEEERREAAKAKRALNALAQASGGLAYYPKELSEVQDITVAVAHEIRNQFIITYSPRNQVLDGSFRQIRVTVNASGKPTVRTRSGYYATPEPKKTASQASARP